MLLKDGTEGSGGLGGGPLPLQKKMKLGRKEGTEREGRKRKSKKEKGK
jgi:hypothetical protein